MARDMYKHRPGLSFAEADSLIGCVFELAPPRVIVRRCDLLVLGLSFRIRPIRENELSTFGV